MTAGWIEPQADGLAPGRPDFGEDTGEPGVLIDVDRVLVAPPAERHVGDPAGKVPPVGAQPDPGRPDHHQRALAGEHGRAGKRRAGKESIKRTIDQHRPVRMVLADAYSKLAGQAGEPGHERGRGAVIDLLRGPRL